MLGFWINLKTINFVWYIHNNCLLYQPSLKFLKSIWVTLFADNLVYWQKSKYYVATEWSTTAHTLGINLKHGIIDFCCNISFSYLSLFWSCKINGYYIKWWAGFFYWQEMVHIFLCWKVCFIKGSQSYLFDKMSLIKPFIQMVWWMYYCNNLKDYLNGNNS